MPTRRSFAVALALIAALSLSPAIYAQKPARNPVIVLIGPTGSGKSTQAQILHKKYGLPIISADALLAQDPGNSTENAGATDSALNQLVRDKLGKVDLSKGVVLDGYPATEGQADYLGGLLQEFGLPNPLVIHFDVPDKLLQKRLSRRGRPEDTPELIDMRLKNYRREMEMARAYYPEANIRKIDGAASAKNVSRQVERVIESLR